MLQSITSSYVTKGSNRVASIAYSTDALLRDLARVHEVFRDFNSSRARDAVYSYLAAIFASEPHVCLVKGLENREYPRQFGSHPGNPGLTNGDLLDVLFAPAVRRSMRQQHFDFLGLRRGGDTHSQTRPVGNDHDRRDQRRAADPG